MTEAHAPCGAAAAKAQQELTLLRSHVQQLAQDRAQAANNIRIAEKEVSPVLAQCLKVSWCLPEPILSTIWALTMFGFVQVDLIHQANEVRACMPFGPSLALLLP